MDEEAVRVLIKDLIKLLKSTGMLHVHYQELARLEKEAEKVFSSEQPRRLTASS